LLAPDVTSWDQVPPVVPNAEGWYPIAMPGSTVAL